MTYSDKKDLMRRKEKVIKIINDLHLVGPGDLDACSVSDLCQLKFALDMLQGSIFVKTVGRLDDILVNPTGCH